MVARFDQPAATTLDELRVELMYPADGIAEQYFPQPNRRKESQRGCRERRRRLRLTPDARTAGA